jgi:hypothetical protein
LLLLLLPVVLAGCGGGTGQAPTEGGSRGDRLADAGPRHDGQPPPPGDRGAIAAAHLTLTTDELATAAAEFADYRRAQGYSAEVARVSELGAGQPSAAVLGEAVHRRLLSMRASLPQGAPLFLLLLGDASGAGRIPAATCVSSLGGCDTDNLYGDLDGDGLPEVAVGRIPAHSLTQARTFLEKLRAHEAGYELGLWNRRVALYTGQANFDSGIDALIEMGAMEGLKRVSHAFDIVGAYDNRESPYYYQPFEQKVLDLFNQGSIMVAYIGHGGAEWTEGLDARQLSAIDCQHRLPVVFFFACLNGDYVGESDSIAEAVLWKAGGPIASLAASEVSHPYGNAILGYESQRAMLDGQLPTVGQAVVQAKRDILEHQDEFRDFIDAAALIEVSAAEQAILRPQNIALYNLFGDPATALKYPRSRASFTPLPGASLATGKLSVSGMAPGLEDGQAWVTLEAERDVILQPLEPVDPRHPDTATVQRNWEKATNKVVAGATVAVVRGAFQAELAWTPPLPGGEYYVKVYGQGTDGRGAASDSFGFVVVR